MNRTMKPRHKQLNDALMSKRNEEHTPKNSPVKRSREKHEFMKMCREYGVQ